MSELAQALLTESKLRLEVIQFLLGLTDRLDSFRTIEEGITLKSIEARYRGVVV